MPEKNVLDTAVIGGGPAGYTAALYAARAGLTVRVFEAGFAGGQTATTEWVENYPGFPDGISGPDLGTRLRENAERFGAVTQEAMVDALNLSAQPKEITVGKEIVLAHTVILAMGASPKRLGVPGEDRLWGRGVSACAACDGAFFRGKTVAVIGGGNTAASDALTLSKLCSQVYVIHRRDTLRAERRSVDMMERTPNIKFVLRATVEEILGEHAVSGLRLNCGGKHMDLPCRGVFLAVGQTPKSELIQGQIAQNEYGYVVAGEDTATNVPGVFAAGDLRVKSLRQILTAASDGAVAAVSASEWLKIEYL